jgi:serine/threonine-protein kinase HipA
MDQIIRAEVRFQGRRAGELAKLEGEGFRFQYAPGYLADINALPIARSFPLRGEAFFSRKLFAFFEGMLAEGFLRRVQSDTQKIDERDSFRLLLNNGEDLIGAVSVLSIKEAS